MKPAGLPRSVQDARTARSLPGRTSAGSEQDAYSRLAQLAREKNRLLEEQEHWQRKLERITRRLSEIDTQADRLTRQVPPAMARAQRAEEQLWNEIEFRY